MRNDASEHARGTILVFVDADVSVSRSAVQGLVRHLRIGADAAFGAYTPLPPDDVRNAATDYKNILHHYTHRHASSSGSTFWSGFGGIRRDVFFAINGFFPEATRSADVEDIQLGIRLRKAGYRIVVDPSLQVRHQKHFTLRSVIKTDIFRRAIPWTHAMLEQRAFIRDLNLKPATLSASIAAWFVVGSAGAAFWYPPVIALSVLGIATWFALTQSFLKFCAEHLGWVGAAKCAALHFFAGLYGPLGAALGAAFWILRRRDDSLRNTLSLRLLPERHTDQECRVTVCLTETPLDRLGPKIVALPAREPWWELIVVATERPAGLAPDDVFVPVPEDTTHNERIRIGLAHAKGVLFAPVGTYLLPSQPWLEAIRAASWRGDLAVAGPIEQDHSSIVRRAGSMARWWQVRPGRKPGWGFEHSPGNIAFDTAAARVVDGFSRPGELIYRLSGFGAHPVRFEPRMQVQADPLASRMKVSGMGGVGRLQASYTVRYFANGRLLRGARAARAPFDAMRQIATMPVQAVREGAADWQFWLAYPLAIPGVLAYHAGVAYGALIPREDAHKYVPAQVSVGPA